MQKRSRSTKDVNQLAHAMAVAIAAGDIPASLDGKNPFAVALGRRGGLKGGKARAESLTPKQRSDSAKKAAQARWRANSGGDK
jgi:hypothetical protein